ncbi:hypothetical protein BDV11DRAFT_183458 [Aspergillus similis]
MDTDSDFDLCEKSGEHIAELLEPAVLFLSGQSVLAEGILFTPLYRINNDIKSIPNKDSTVSFARLEDASAPELEGTSSKRQRHRHPANAQYRTDIPARYFIT